MFRFVLGHPFSQDFLDASEDPDEPWPVQVVALEWRDEVVEIWVWTRLRASLLHLLQHFRIRWLVALGVLTGPLAGDREHTILLPFGTFSYSLCLPHLALLLFRVSGCPMA